LKSKKQEPNIAYIQRHSELVDDLAKEYGVTRDEAIEVIDHFFRTLKEMLQDIRMPRVHIRKWGTFGPTVKYLERSINATLYHMEKGNGNAETMFLKMNYLLEIRNRLLKEKAGEETWTEWKNKEMPDYRDKFKERSNIKHVKARKEEDKEEDTPGTKTD